MKKALQVSRTKFPRGTATHLPEGASLRRYVQETILATFFKWGYKEVVTPVFEYLDVLSAGLSSGLLEKSYKFVDRESGKLIVLRPDITPQIARMVAGILADEPKPLRLCYYGNVFRYEESHAGREQEIFQVGCELVGTSLPGADAEIIAVASEAIRNFEIEGFKIVIGHASYLQGIINLLKDPLKYGLSSDDERALQEAVRRKDSGPIESILDRLGVSGGMKKNILQVPGLFGGEEILDRASLIASNKESSAAIENLRQVYAILCLCGLKDYILFDLCDIREIDYYTGLFFEIFAPGMAYPIGRGGRYDNLIGRFGYDSPSTGFAIDIESIIMPVERKGRFLIDKKGIKYLISGDIREAIELARVLRDKGCRVITEIGVNSADNSIQFAEENGVESVIIIESGEAGEEKQFFTIDVKTGKKIKVRRDKIIS